MAGAGHVIEFGRRKYPFDGLVIRRVQESRISAGYEIRRTVERRPDGREITEIFFEVIADGFQVQTPSIFVVRLDDVG